MGLSSLKYDIRKYEGTEEHKILLYSASALYEVMGGRNNTYTSIADYLAKDALYLQTRDFLSQMKKFLSYRRYMTFDDVDCVDKYLKKANTKNQDIILRCDSCDGISFSMSVMDKKNNCIFSNIIVGKNNFNEKIGNIIVDVLVYLFNTPSPYDRANVAPIVNNIFSQ